MHRWSILITVQRDATKNSLFIKLQPPVLVIWPVTEAVVTVLCTPGNRCGWQLKHVEWTCRIINRMLCVASRWTVINITEGVYCVTVIQVTERCEWKDFSTNILMLMMIFLQQAVLWFWYENLEKSVLFVLYPRTVTVLKQQISTKCRRSTSIQERQFPFSLITFTVLLHT